MAALDPVAREEVLPLEALIGIVLAGILLLLIVAVAIAWIGKGPFTLTIY